MKLPVIILAIIFNTLILTASDSTKVIRSSPPFPIEILVGKQRMYYQLLMNRKISNNGKIGLINISSYSSDLNIDISKNEFLTSSAIYYNLFKGLGLNIGASFNSIEGLNPYLGVQYFYSDKRITLLLMPSYSFYQSKLATLLMLEYRIPLGKGWSFYSRFQGFMAIKPETSDHMRSYAYGRLGASYQQYTCGLGINSDWYSINKLSKNYLGLFIRIAL
jgi:hypothetical protein